MAKRELSNTLRNLKFMQRGVKVKQEEEAIIPVVVDDGNFFSPATVKKCVVVMEGDPHPGAVIGRMSFQRFNPSIDKMNETAANPSQPDASVSSSGGQSGKTSFRESASSQDGMNEDNTEATADLKRKQSDVESKPQYPNKSPKSSNGAQQSSPGSSKGFKKPKPEKTNWSALRPPKSKQKK
ncbi:hypothetical protein ACFE04_015163 [Oxalis oulophora]